MRRMLPLSCGAEKAKRRMLPDRLVNAAHVVVDPLSRAAEHNVVA
jgi:hypothetical protein